MASSASISLSPSEVGRGRGGAAVGRGGAGRSVAADPGPRDTAAVDAGRRGGSAAAAVATATELRVYLPIGGLQRQFAAYLGVPTRARGYPPAEGDHALIVEGAAGLAIEGVPDLALRAEPAVE